MAVTRFVSRALAAGVAFLFVLALAACGGGSSSSGGATGGGTGTGGGGGGGTGTPTLFSITVTPGLPASMPLGLTQQFTATATYVNYTTGAYSTVDVTSTATWTSSAPAVASISATGLAKGLTVGATNISATLSGMTSFNAVTLNVIAAQLQGMTISPTSATIAAGQSTQFTVTGSYTDGTTQNLNSAVWWTSSNTAAATVNAGLAFGAAPSATPVTLTASYSTFTVTAALTVTNYSIGGTVVDLPVGSSVTIQNGADVLTIAGNGATPVPFIFPTGVAAGGTYNVTVATQPGGAVHACTVVDGGGTIVANFISFAQVVCGPAVSTFAGGLNVLLSISGTTTALTPFGAGFANGTGTAALFSSPYGAAYDTLGNLYVADFGNCMIRKITPAGVVSTFAGSGAVGSANSTNPLLATFSYPTGVALDSSNNVYVADQGNGLIRKITQAGVVTTYAGAGGVGSTNSTNPLLAKFTYPQGVAVDSSGNVYVADTGNNMIRKIATNGTVTTLAGSTTCTTLTNGSGTAACFNVPTGVTVDKTNAYLYVSDSFNNAIRQIVLSNQAVTTLAGAGTAGYLDGACATALFSTPSNVAVDAANNLYVADTGGGLIRKIVGANTTGCTVSILAGLTGSPGNFSDGPATSAMLSAYGIAVDAANNVFFTDTGKHLLRKYTP